MKTLKLNTELFETYETIMGQLLQCGADQVMVAGGAVRDVLLDKPIKDIDIFYTGELDVLKVYDYFNQIPTRFGDDLNMFYDNEDNDWIVTYNRMRSKLTKHPLQFIQCKDFTAHLKTFGVGLSQVALLADGTLWITPEFMKDVTTECLHFHPNCGEKYRDKICDKYPEYEAMDECLY